MKNTAFLLLLLMFSITGFAQQDFCFENSSGPYWPVKPGPKKYYGRTTSSYTSQLTGDSLQVSGHVYYKSIDDYGKGKTETTYLREEQGDVFVYDTEKKIEFMELSSNTTPGYSWEKYDKAWKYTVIDTNGSVTTPYCKFEHLLNIKAEPQGKTKENYSSYFNLYYKRGVGLVSIYIEDKGYSFLSVDPSLVIIENFTANGCELLTTEKEKRECTAKKINQFLTDNMRFEKRPKKGTITIRYTISEEGKTEDVVPVQTIKNAEDQIQEAVRVIKMLTFIPRKINGKATKTTVIIPVNF